jgi:hypothetical protein
VRGRDDGKTLTLTSGPTAAPTVDASTGSGYDDSDGVALESILPLRTVR